MVRTPRAPTTPRPMCPGPAPPPTTCSPSVHATASKNTGSTSATRYRAPESIPAKTGVGRSTYRTQIGRADEHAGAHKRQQQGSATARWTSWSVISRRAVSARLSVQIRVRFLPGPRRVPITDPKWSGVVAWMCPSLVPWPEGLSTGSARRVLDTRSCGVKSACCPTLGSPMDKWELEFYEEDDGSEPVADWLRKLVGYK